ncbi:MAG TPA: hypothetical protein VM778_10860, partial [Gemmatimonadota bacterium]|nr:hypothetical protein [Gemmatimonadota bacterium]
DQAAHLVGFLHCLRDRNGVRFPSEAEERIAEVERGIIGAPAEDAWRQSRSEGARFTLSQGIHYALELAAPSA